LRRSWNRRWPLGLALLTVVVLGLTGCVGGAAQATSWTGLTVVEDTIYAADVERVVALDAAEGEPLWSFPRDPKEDNRGLFYATPTVVGDVIIVASEMPARGFFSAPRHVVWGLDPQGRDLWSFDGASGQYVEGGAAADGVFVIGNSDGSVYALDVNTGDLKWKFKTGHRVWATPLIVGGTVYIGSMDRHFYALRLEDGSVIWDFRGGGAFASRPALSQDGTLYIGAFDDKVYALDAETGSLRWTFPGANWFWGAVALVDDTLYAADVNGNVYAIDAASGAERWRHALLDDKQRPATVRAGPVPSADGALIYVGSRTGTLYALDARDGREVWTATSDGQIYSEPVVVGRVVYYPMIYGSERIRAMAADNGRKIWAYAPQSAK
jgi:outer membrane protein assembly factor BamB